MIRCFYQSLFYSSIVIIPFIFIVILSFNCFTLFQQQLVFLKLLLKFAFKNLPWKSKNFFAFLVGHLNFDEWCKLFVSSNNQTYPLYKNLTSFLFTSLHFLPLHIFDVIFKNNCVILPFFPSLTSHLKFIRYLLFKN